MAMENRERKIEGLKINYCVYKTRISDKYRNRKPYQPADPRKIVCYIPGTIVEIEVKEGDRVIEGQELLILEAMKMKNRIKSPVEGVVKKINVSLKEKVPKGRLLIEVE